MMAAGPPNLLRLYVILITGILYCMPAGMLYAANNKIPITNIIHKDAQHIRDSLSDIIKSLQIKYQIPGVSLTLVRGNEVLWSEGFGYADIENSVPATTQTLYRAGSLAKPFTAMAIMQLAEKNAVDIDQPVFIYLPEFNIKSRFDITTEPITPRNILCHHSGLPTDLNKGMWSNERFTSVTARLKEEYTAFPPNLVFSYSNVGYTLLGHIIEESEGISFEPYMLEKILLPLGMSNSSMGATTENLPLLARGYHRGARQEFLPIRDLPAFGLRTSAHDLGHFMRTLLTSKELSESGVLMPETLEEMMEPQNQDVPLDLNIINGLGWFIEEDSMNEEKMLIRHGGTTLYHSSELIISPQMSLGVAVLANASGSRKIVSNLAEEILRLAHENADQPEKNPLRLEHIERDVDEPTQSKITGNYATDFGLISIQAKDDQLCGCIAEETFDLIPYPNGWFGIHQDSVDSLPPSFKALGELRYKTQIIDDMEVIVAQKGDEEILLGEKIPPEPIPQAWVDRVGIYQVHNADERFPITDTELLIQDDQLYMKYKMPLLSARTIVTPIRAISDNEAIILGLGRTRGETIRAIPVKGSDKEVVRYSGYIGSKE